MSEVRPSFYVFDMTNSPFDQALFQQILDALATIFYYSDNNRRYLLNPINWRLRCTRRNDGFIRRFILKHVSGRRKDLTYGFGAITRLVADKVGLIPYKATTMKGTIHIDPESSVKTWAVLERLCGIKSTFRSWVVRSEADATAICTVRISANNYEEAADKARGQSHDWIVIPESVYNIRVLPKESE